MAFAKSLVSSQKGIWVASGACLTVGAFLLVSLWAGGNTATADDEAVTVSEPMDTFSGSELAAEVVEEAENNSGLEYPSEAAEEAALQRLDELEFDEGTEFGEGIEQNIVLDNWECVWLEYASVAAAENDLAGMQEAAEAISSRAEIPGQREELFPDVDRYNAIVIEPMARGDWGPASEVYENNCAAYVEVRSIP